MALHFPRSALKFTFLLRSPSHIGRPLRIFYTERGAYVRESAIFHSCRILIR